MIWNYNFYTNNVKTIRDNFKKSSLTPEFKTRKQLIKHPLDYFTEVTDDDIMTIVMELANKQSVLNAIPCSLFKQLHPVLLPSLNVIINDSLRGFFPYSNQNGYSYPCI